MSRIGRAVLGLLAALACVVAPAGTATAMPAADGPACAITYRPWAHTGGFTAEIIIRNSGTATIYGWTLSFPLNEGAEIVDMWNAELDSPSGLISARNTPDNGRVDPGAAISLGFLASGTAAGVPSPFTVNGIICTLDG